MGVEIQCRNRRRYKEEKIVTRLFTAFSAETFEKLLWRNK